MKTRFILPVLGLALSIGLLLAGCQTAAGSAQTSGSAASSVNAATVASAQSAPSSTAAASSRPLTITEEFTHPGRVEKITDLKSYIKDFPYSDIKAENLSDAWAQLMERAEIGAYPEGLLEYAEYELYQNYLDMATYYGTDLETMLKEKMDLSHDEMVAEIQREAKAYIDASLVARYILDKEKVVTGEALAEVSQYTLTGGGQSAADSLAAASADEKETALPQPTAMNISAEEALALANGWISDNLVAH